MKKKLFIIGVVCLADLFAVWMILEGDWGDLGGFLVVCLGCLFGRFIFKTFVPLLVHIIIFLPLFFIASSWYWSHMYTYYDQQFQPIRELSEITILKEMIYQEKRFFAHTVHTMENKAFLVQYSHNAESLQQLLYQALDIHTLLNVADFHLFPRKYDSAAPRTATVPFGLHVADREKVLREPSYQRERDELGDNADILEKADYLVIYYYYIIDWKDD